MGTHKQRIFLVRKKSYPCTSTFDSTALWYAAPFPPLTSAHSILPVTPGPVAGDPFPSVFSATPAVTVDFFKEVCPNPTVIDPNVISSVLLDHTAANIVQAMLDKLERTEDRCVEPVEVKASARPIFDYMCVLVLPRPTPFPPLNQMV